MATTTAEIHATACVEVRNGAAWVRLSIRLAEPFVGGNVARIAADTPIDLVGADEVASTYTITNWLSGIASGAFYAFRTLKVPRQVVVVADLAGRLGAGDIQVLAYAAARAIADLLHQELALPELDGWQIPSTAVSKNGMESN